MSNFNYPRIPDDQYKKFRYKLNMAFSVILKDCFPMHYSNEDRTVAVEVLVKAAEEFAMEVRGKPVPVYLPKEYQWRAENEVYRADD